MEKLCPKCKIITECKGTYCVSCKREHGRQYYQNGYKETKKKVVKYRQQALRKWIDALKEEMQCACGEKRIGCLSFHHKDPKIKEFQIAVAANKGWSKKRILEEMAKCEVICANCHMHLHWLERQEK